MINDHLMCYIFITYQAFLYEWLLSSHYRLYNIEGLQLVFSPKTHQHRPRAFQGSEGLEHSWSFSLPSWKNNLFSIINFLDYKTFIIHHCIVFSASKMSFQFFPWSLSTIALLVLWKPTFSSQLYKKCTFQGPTFFFSTVITCAACFMLFEIRIHI